MLLLSEEFVDSFLVLELKKNKCIELSIEMSLLFISKMSLITQDIPPMTTVAVVLVANDVLLISFFCCYTILQLFSTNIWCTVPSA